MPYTPSIIKYTIKQMHNIHNFTNQIKPVFDALGIYCEPANLEIRFITADDIAEKFPIANWLDIEPVQDMYDRNGHKSFEIDEFHLFRNAVGIKFNNNSGVKFYFISEQIGENEDNSEDIFVAEFIDINYIPVEEEWVHDNNLTKKLDMFGFEYTNELYYDSWYEEFVEKQSKEE